MILLSLIFCMLSASSVVTDSPDHEVISDWKVDKTKNGIEISYRFLMVGDTFKTREMRIAFELQASVTEILPMFYLADNFESWSAGIERCELVDEADSVSWTMYNLYDVPWPFKQRDLITKYTVTSNAKETTLMMEGRPDALPETEGVLRMRNYEGYWQLKPLSTKLTEVEFHSISFTKPIAPRWIQDPIVQGAFINSIARLRDLVVR